MMPIRRQFDAMLNQFTMYTGILSGLATLLLCAEVMAITGLIGVSALGLVASIAVLIVCCYGANKLLNWAFSVPVNRESWLITALILACILPPSTSASRLLLIGFAGVIAMASKFLIAFRGSLILNPAATGAFVLSVVGLLPATWWIATPPLAPVAALIGLVVLYRNRKFSLFWAFALVSITLLLYISVVLRDETFFSALSNAWLSWPIIFLGSIMLTEPSTLPRGRYLQVIGAMLVGAVFASQLHVGPISATPQLALLVGNVFAFAVTPASGYLLKLKHRRHIAQNIYEFTFHKPQNLRFKAGQYMEWTLPHKHTDIRGNRRTFSISSSPLDDELKFAIRVTMERSSSFKKALFAMEPGHRLRAAHVEGEFVRPADPSQPMLLIAGGIGITPFVSMIRAINEQAKLVDIKLIYIAAKEAAFGFKHELAATQKHGVHVEYRVGRLSASELQHLVPDIHRRVAYISGPDAMVTDYAHHLRQLGAKSIKTDHFSGY